MTQTPTMTAGEWEYDARKKASLATKVRHLGDDIVRVEKDNEVATDERRELWAAIAELRAEVNALKQEAAVAAR